LGALRQSISGMSSHPQRDQAFEAETQSGAWLHAGACTARGPRPLNEDLLQCDWSSIPEWPAGLFAVFDGHGGAAVSVLAARMLAKSLWTEMQGQASSSESEPAWKSQKGRRGAVERAFLGLDASLSIKSVANRAGCTCTAAIVWPSDLSGEAGDVASDARSGSWQVLLANLGDSRGVVLRSEGTAIEVRAETVDHRPNLPEESRRIIAAGGMVQKSPGPAETSPSRIDGDLSVSRAFGDFRFKGNFELKAVEQKVSPLPDVYEMTCRASDFVLLACDGVFDVMSSKEAGEIACGGLCRAGREDSKDEFGSGAASRSVVEAALAKHTFDNVTCVVLQAKGAPLLTGEAPVAG